MTTMKNCPHCPDGVHCSTESSCTRCGWNPKVAKARLEKIKEGKKK